MSEKNNHSRRKFLGKALAVMTVAAFDPLTVLLSDKDIFASGGNGTLGQFKVDLSQTEYKKLRSINGSVRIEITQLSKPNNFIIVTRTGTAGFSVVNAYCTHEGNLVDPFDGEVLPCSAPANEGHGSQYTVDGKLILFSGPAKFDLAQYTWTFDGTTILLIDLPALIVKDGKLVANLPVMYQNFPNPVKDITTIRVKMNYFSPVVLSVTDIRGNIIAVLHDGGLGAGEHSFDFDASIFGSGMYYYHLSAACEVQTKQMMVVK